MFVPGTPFQPSLMFTIRPGVEWSIFQGVKSMTGLFTNNRLWWKSLPGTNTMSVGQMSVGQILYSTNVCWANVCSWNVYWPNVRWPNVCWPNVCWPNICCPNICCPNICCPKVCCPKVCWKISIVPMFVNLILFWTCILKCFSAKCLSMKCFFDNNTPALSPIRATCLIYLQL